jgi:hypothetical protein
MKSNHTTFKVLLSVLAGIILCIIVYLMTTAPKKDDPREEFPKDQKKEEEKGLDEQEKAPILLNEGKKPATDYEEKRELAKAPNAPPKPGATNEGESPSTNNFLNEAIQKQVSLLYKDLFKELALEEEPRKEVEEHLIKSMRYEAEFDLKIFDPNISVDEILQYQDKLSRQQRGRLGEILTPSEEEVVKKYQSELPKKRQEQQIAMLLNNLHLEAGEKENVKNALERAMQNVEEKKKIGEYTAQDITNMRKQFGNAKPGDPEFMRASIEDSAKKINGILKDLKHLPIEQYEAIKKQMEMPLEMMRQGMKQHENGASR